MRLKKKIAACLATAILGTTIFTMPVFAGNSADTTYDFYLGMNAEYLDARAKLDDSSCYVYCTSNNIPGTYVWVAAMGCQTASSKGENVTLGNANLRYTGGQRFIKQYVYEKGYTYARLRFNRGDASGTIRGVWSPDSVGNYPSLN